jgi:hypothetical protein
MEIINRRSSEREKGIYLSFPSKIRALVAEGNEERESPS